MGAPTYAQTKRGYSNLWDKAQVKNNWRIRTQAAVNRVKAGRARYVRIAAKTGVPWQWIGAIHSLEAGNRFSGHLHNGDNLARRTVHVPAGRPRTGTPPFTWEQSAFDALQMHGLHKIRVWPMSRQLYEAERYNGWGYFYRGAMSAYLWSGTTLYARGKYVADGRWSSSAVSRQVGVVPILKMLGVGGAVTPVEMALVIPPMPERSPVRRATNENFIVDWVMALWRWLKS